MIKDLKIGQRVYILSLDALRGEEPLQRGTVEYFGEHFIRVELDAGGFSLTPSDEIQTTLFGTKEEAMVGITGWLEERRADLFKQIGSSVES